MAALDTHVQTIAEKTAAVATYAGSGTAFAFGLSSSEWQAIGVFGGLVIAVIGLLAKVLIDIHFKNEHLKLAQSRAKVLAEEAEADE